MLRQNYLIMTLSVCTFLLVTNIGWGQTTKNSTLDRLEKLTEGLLKMEAALTRQQERLDLREAALEKKEADFKKREADLVKREFALQRHRKQVSEKSAFPATLEGAKAFVSQFVKKGADVEKLSKQLQPTHEDYLKVFNEEFAKKAEATYTPIWKSGVFVIRGKPEQTNVFVFSGTSDDLKQWKGTASQRFPGGYKNVAKEYNDGITIYCFKFIKPGEKYGMAFNGLVHVNGHWRIIPKPYRIK